MARVARHVEVGRAGERAAVFYLMVRGYRVVERNYRNKWAEIDLVMQRGGTLVFVEVRTHCGESLSRPEETLTAEKLQRLRCNAQAYAARRQWRGACRIDAVCVVLAERRFGLGYRVVRLNHYDNITT